MSGQTAATPQDPWKGSREAMVDKVRAYGVRNEPILAAMRKVPRHLFIPEPYRSQGDPYADCPAPIGCGQTISQPFIVAYMIDALRLAPGDRVLEVGVGSGYQAAILSELGADVCAMDIVPALVERARDVLNRLGCAVRLTAGDGYAGWPEHAPYRGILTACSPPEVPPALIAQLADGGRMILPVGTTSQRLVVLRKERGEVVAHDDLPVRFVPMVHGKVSDRE